MLSLQDELLVNLLLDTILNKASNKIGVLIELLKQYTEKTPEDLASITSCIGVLSSIAINTKNKQLAIAGNSMQFLMTIDILKRNFNKKNTEPFTRIKLLTGAMLTIFPTGEKLAASADECKFFDSFIEDIKNCDKDELIDWAKREGYEKYINKLLNES